MVRALNVVLLILNVACASFVFNKFAGSKEITTLAYALELNSPSKSHISAVVRVVDNVEGVSCSAFVIDNHHAITAAHCIFKSKRLVKNRFWIYANKTNTHTQAQAVAYDSGSDLGLLEGDFSRFRHVKVTMSDQDYRDRIFVACGYADGKPSYICNGFIPHKSFYQTLQGFGEVIPGMSGGPVLDLESGEAVAVISGYGPKGVAYTAPLSEFFEVFPEYRR